MASKVLKDVKAQNEALKEAMESQKEEEKSAKKAYKEAKSNSGLFASKEEKMEAKRAKLQYEQEKEETKHGEALQEQGKTMQSMVKSESRTFGVFHSDKKLSEPTKETVAKHKQSVDSFVNKGSGKTAEAENEFDTTKESADSKSVASQVADKAASKVESTAKRALPSMISNLVSGKSDMQME